MKTEPMKLRIEPEFVEPKRSLIEVMFGDQSAVRTKQRALAFLYYCAGVALVLAAVALVLAVWQ